MNVIDREALALNEKPFVLSFFPSGNGVLPENALTLSDTTVLLTAFKKAELSLARTINRLSVWIAKGEPLSP